jgi:hypothetical protein
MPPRKEQQLLHHARREGLLLLTVWGVALLWSCGYSRFFGYERSADDISLILGIPDWVFWGIVIPWAICVVFTFWFCFFFMSDDDLGRDPDERHGDA